MANLCIIPARGGSKRIPRKNIKEFLGKPIIAYSIETALQSGLFEEVMVSTDDQEISTIAQAYGAKVPFLRSEENSDDMSPAINVVKEVIASYNTSGKVFHYVCCMFPTAPLVSEDKLREGFNTIKKGFESVFPVVAYGHPIWRGLVRENDKTKMLWQEHANTRSQDLQPVYHDAGQWYWLNANKLPDALLAKRSSSVLIDELETQDIDTTLDWKLAELKYQLLK